MAVASKRKYHYIYKIICEVTNKFYIGMHSTDDLDDGYFGSGKRLWFSINYHGKGNHSKEILEFLPTRQALKNREKELVNVELLDEELCLNLQIGGGGGFSSEQHAYNFHSAGGRAVRRMKSAEHSHRLKTDEDYKAAWKSAIKQGLAAAGYSEGTFKGKQHREESKALIGDANRGKGTGSSNSQYGTCWITNGSENKKVSKADELPEGWSYGRFV